MKVLTLTTNLNHPGFLQFKKFYTHFGWEIEVLNPAVSNFGEQMPHIIDWCRNNRGIRFMYCDAWDTISLAGLDELLEKLPDCEFYGGAERGCWPDHTLTELFPNLDRPYKYPCGGTWITTTDWLIEMADTYPNVEKHNDQHWLQLCFLKCYRRERKVLLDNYGDVFQSIMLDAVEDMEIKDGRVINKLTNAMPIILHGNGKKDMSRYYEILCGN